MQVELIPNGTKVRYHGSLSMYHGMMTVDGFHQEREDTGGEYSPLRYVLRYGEGWQDVLHNVRPESFTVMREPGLEDE